MGQIRRFCGRAIALVLVMMALMPAMARADEGQKREMRTVWIATVSNIDWPKTVGTGATVIAKQKKELLDMLDGFQRSNMNSVILQVRPMADAFYRSSYEPWTRYLTGTRGLDPGWDPLEFAVEECHKRGLELHAWVNPYRFSTNSGNGQNTAIDQEIKASGVLIQNGDYVTFNPALESSIQRVVNVCREMIENYDIDGIIFDDYFYPSGGLTTGTDAPDYEMWQNSGTSLSLADWRRANVNRMVHDVYAMVQETKPYVKFGIGPAGVAGTAKTSAGKHGVDPCPVGSDWQYNTIFSDPLAWLEEGTIDYISPQLYWKTTHSTNPFGPLTQWWSYIAHHYGRHHYASHNIYFMADTNTQEDWDEILTQIGLSRQYNLDNAPGVNFYSAQYINGPRCTGFGDYLRENMFTTHSLVPALTWKPMTNFDAPTGVAISGKTITWDPVNVHLLKHAVYAVPMSLSPDDVASERFDGIKSDYLLGVTYDNSMTLPDDVLADHWFAVTVVDGWGNEFDPAFLGADFEESQNVQLIAPVDEVADWEAEFSWTESPAAKYRLQIAADATFSNIVAEYRDIETNSLTIDLDSLAPSTTYYWRVKVSQPAKLTVISPIESFSTPVREACAVTTLVSPQNGEKITTDIKFVCSAVAADGYELEVAVDPNFDNVIYSTTQWQREGSNMSCTMLTGYYGKGTFYWRVTTTRKHYTPSVSETRKYIVEATPVGETEEGYVMTLDDGTYNALDGEQLTNLWFRAVRDDYGNFSQTLNGSLNRGFTAIGDKIYVAGRDENSANSTTYLAVYNGDTGEFTKRLDLGNEATVSFYPVNSVVTDDAGHLIVSNLVTNVSKNPLYLYQVNPLTGALTLRAALTCPEVLATPRIDHCDVAGDVESGNFVVFAPTSRGNFVIRWIFEDGVLVDTEALDVTQFYPANAGDFSTAPQIMAVDENTFYVDGASTYFARYDFDNGTLTGSLKGYTQLIPERAGGNGGTAFSTMGNNYMVYSYSDFAGSIGWRFILAANHVDDEFANYTKCWILPEKGFGKLNNSSCSAQCVAVPTADSYVTRLYVYVPGNGLAAYDLRLKVKKGDVNADGVVNVIDVTMVINYVLGETDIPGFDVQAADAIGDGEIDVKDVTCIINIALGM